MSQAFEDPKWAPKNATLETDREDKHVRVHVSRTSGDIEFGEIPANWTITVDMRHARTPVSIAASKAGANVTLRLTGLQSHNTAVRGSAFRTVELVDTQANGAPLELTDSDKRHGVRLIVRPGAYRVTAQRLKVTVLGSADKPVALGGNSSISSIRGTGTLTLNPPGIRGHTGLAQGCQITHFEGQLNVGGDLTDATVATPATRLHVRGSVQGSNVRVLEMSCGAVSRSHVRTVERLSVGEATSTAALEWASEELRVQNPNARVPANGSANASSLITDSGDLQVRDATDCELEVAGSLYGNLLQWAEASAKSVEVGKDLIVGATLEGADRVVVGGNAYIAALSNVPEAEVASMYVGNDLCGVGHLRTARARISGTVEGSFLHAGTMAVLEGNIDAGSSVTLSGDAELEQGSEGPVRWEPSVLSVLESAGDIEHLQVSHDLDGCPLLLLGEQATVNRIRSRGGLVIGRSLSSPRPQCKPLALESLVYEDDSFVGVQAQGDLTISEVAAEAQPTLFVSAAPKTDTRVCVPRDSCLRLLSPGAKIALSASGAEERDGDGRPPAADLGGGSSYLVETTLGDVRTGVLPDWLWNLRFPEHEGFALPEKSQAAERVPTLDVPEAGTVFNLIGRVRIGFIDGRVSSTRAVLDDFRDQEKERCEGQLTGVDPTRLRFEQMQHLRQLHVFEPHGGALREYAQPRSPNETTFDRQDRAQKAHLLAEIVSRRATTGSTRSSARWAAARAHHLTINGWWEHFGRTAHQAVGYSQRPGPALKTWGASAALLTLSLIGYEIWAAEEHHWHIGHGTVFLLKSFFRVIFLPAALLRLPARDGGAAQLYMDNYWIHVPAFILVAITTIYAVIAIKNFLKSPVED